LFHRETIAREYATQEADIGSTVGHGVEDGRRHHVAERQRNSCVLALKVPHDRREETVGHGREIRDGECANRATSRAARAVRTGSSPRQDGLGICQKHPSGVSQRHTAVCSRQQLDAELLLQIADLLAEGRLLDMDSFGGTAEVQGVGDGDEVSEVAQLHALQRNI
jgi:hypothetical protein